MATELDEINDWLEPLITQISPKQRAAFLKRLASSLRSRQAQRIAAQKNPDGSSFTPRKKQNSRGKAKKRASLFQLMRKTRHLKVRSGASGLAIGFAGKTARIAAVHQEGKIEKVSKSGPLHKYTVRKLLGLSPEDLIFLIEEFENYIEN